MISGAEAADPFSGLTIGSALQPDVKLRIERRLGEGGTAAAYFATRFGPDGTSPAVVKIILPSIIAQASDTARPRNGLARAWLHRPLMWDTEPLSDVAARAFTAYAALSERELGIAVGTDGAVLRVERGRVELLQLPSAPNLASVALDPLGRVWAGAAGQLWYSADTGLSWQLAWRDERWSAPFVSIFADVGMVFAATADGAVLECRTTLSTMM